MLTMGGRLVLLGLGVGVAVSLASTRLLRSQLFGVEAADPLAYAGRGRSCWAWSRSSPATFPRAARPASIR